MIDNEYFQHKFGKDENNFNIYIVMIKKIERSLNKFIIGRSYFNNLLSGWCFNKDDNILIMGWVIWIM